LDRPKWGRPTTNAMTVTVLDFVIKQHKSLKKCQKLFTNGSVVLPSFLAVNFIDSYTVADPGLANRGGKVERRPKNFLPLSRIFLF